MKKIILPCLLSLAINFAASASLIPASLAKTVAVNFYKQNSSKAVSTVVLADTKMGAIATSYYVFNINTNDGFVIVAADDASIPILAYNDKGHYDISNLPPSFASWMKKYVKELDYIQQHNIIATVDITTEWYNYTNGISSARTMSAVLPLSDIMWGQGWPYNGMCPGGSVTGCVATAMSQIMRYWKYPAHGLLFNSFNENTPQYSNNYGIISRNFYNDDFNWANMPDTPSSNNPDVALLNVDAGISVDMNYDPSGSNAQVVAGDDTVCAQTAYVKFFGYNRYTVRGYYAANFTNAVWLNMMENELNNGRIIQYAGGGDIGHTWVCEGYNASSQFYMNWGWNTSANGYFALNALNPYSYNFDSIEEAVIGIQPPAANAQFISNTVSVHTGNTVNFTDESLTPTNITSWNWSFPGGTPAMSNSQNPTVTYNTPGQYNVTLIVTANGGADTMTKTNYIIVQPNNNPLPLSENFESGLFPPTGWYLNNPNGWMANDDSGYGKVWRLLSTPGCGGYSASNGCMMFNNFNKDFNMYLKNQPPWPNPLGGQKLQIYTPAYDFTTQTKDYLYFDIAYEPWDAVYSDSLAVYYSLNCGLTWSSIYLKGGSTLATTANKLSSDTTNHVGFVPASNQWRTETMQLPSPVYGQPSVMFSFENRSGWGGQLYIDNINVSSTLGVNNISTNNGVVIYPNPSNGVFTVQSSLRGTKQSLQIYNVLGEKALTLPLSQAGEGTQIDLSGKPAGIYLYRIITEKGDLVSTGKLILQ
jgi:PKD repeat protein